MKRLERILAAVVMTLATATFAVAILTGCGGPRGVTPPIAPAVEARAEHDERFARGQLVFMNYCNSCHPQAGAGLGPHLYELPVTNNMIAFQVRRGLGVMPSFDEQQIPDPELDDLIHYLDEVEEVEVSRAEQRGLARASRARAAARPR